MRLTRSWLATLVFVAGSTLNPAYILGCGVGDDEPDFKYGAEELVGLLEQANGSFELEATMISDCPGDTACTSGAVSHRIELELTPENQAEAGAVAAGWLGKRAHACGSRELFASASACFDYSTMNVQGSVTITRLDADSETRVVEAANVEGQLRVIGLTLSNAELDVRFDGGTLTFRSFDGSQFEDHRLTLRP